jgi:type IV secretion system protein VirB3
VREQIYKGATRPAVWLGVPLIPFIVATGLAFLVAMWGMFCFGLTVLVFVGAIYAPSIAWMAHITKKDDQRLKQWMLRAQLGLRARVRVWGGARSYALVDLRRFGSEGRP